MPDFREVQAGRLRGRYSRAALRYLRLGKMEILRHVYMAVRDRNWNTIGARISAENIVIGDESFEISFAAEHVQGEIDFEWQGRLGGSRDSIEVEMDGVARRSFLKNRIGWCVLHPTREYAGHPTVVDHCDGTQSHGTFPAGVSPHQPFYDIRALTVEVAPGVTVKTEFEGDVFETEDHRNWTDDSFKTYSTPLKLPFPALIEKGQRVRQRVRVSLTGGDFQVSDPAPIRIDVDPLTTVKWPRIGLCTSSEPLDSREAGLIRALCVDHLRLDLQMGRAGWQESLRRAQADATATGARLEVAVHVFNPDSDFELLSALAHQLQVDVIRWLVFDADVPATRRSTLKLARIKLQEVCPGAAFLAGTDANFAELNRNRSSIGGADAVTYSVNPQVHGSDEHTIIENLPAQAATVETARSFADGRPVVISPLTLKPRFNAVATGEEDFAGDDLPSNVDIRQRDPFAAAWLTISLKYLAESGAASITLFETAGWRGVLERTGGSEQPQLFPSSPGELFPVYHALAKITRFAPEAVGRCRSSDPLTADAMVLLRNGVTRILVANLTASGVELELRLPESETIRLRLEGYEARAVGVPDR